MQLPPGLPSSQVSEYDEPAIASVITDLGWGLRRMGFQKGDAYFKQMGKGMHCTYVLIGAGVALERDVSAWLVGAQATPQGAATGAV